MARAGRLAAVAVTGAAAAVGVYAALVARAVPGYALVDDTPLNVAVLLGIGWLVCLVGLVAWGRRPTDPTGGLVVALGITWFVAQWQSPGAGYVFGPVAGPAFTGGLVVVAAAPAVVAHVALAYPGGRLRSWPRRGLAAAGYTTLVGVFGLGGTLFFDPLGQGCACPVNVLLLRADAALSTALSRIGLVLGAGWALSTTVFLAVAFARASAAARRIALPMVAPASACLLLAAASFAAGTRRGYLGTSGLEADLRLAEAATLVAVAAGVGWGLLRSRRVQAALARSVVRLAGDPGRQLRDDLADLLDDPGLVIAHRLDDGRVVDSDARPVDLSTHGRAVSEIPVAGSSVLLLHRAGVLDSPVLRDELASAAGLALTNDRLRARTLAQVAELRASQIRIVRAGDSERRRLERDLHDGAQQRLVGILLGLKLLLSGAGTQPDILQQAADELRRAMSDLRDLSHGLYPTVLSDEGLGAALHALAETTRLTVGPVPSQRLPTEIETTAYLVVARATSIGTTSVGTTVEAGILSVSMGVQGTFDCSVLADRVAALGGSMTAERDTHGDTRVSLVLPAHLASCT